MVTLKAASVPAFVERPDPAIFCMLIYGPDAGLVHERAEKLAKSELSDPDDPFALVRLDGDVIAADPGRLIDEATTTALFGGERAIWIRLGSRSIAPAVETLLNGPEPAARVVIEAGDIRRNAPVCALCERHPRAATLPCYADGPAELGQLIDREVRAAGFGISPDARRHLVGLLGADRIATRNEIEKLLLYAQGSGTIEITDIDAVIADSGNAALDEIVDAAFAGDIEALEAALTTFLASGGHPSVPLLMALRQALLIQRCRLAMDQGAAPGQALERTWPRLHFRRKPLIEKAVSCWHTERLTSVISRLSDAVLDARRLGVFGAILAGRTLAAIAAEARRRR